MRRAPNSDAADGIAGRGARRVVPPLPPDQVSLSHDQSLRRPARRRRLPRGAEDGARASKSRKVRLSEGKVVRQKFIGRAIARRVGRSAHHGAVTPRRCLAASRQAPE